MFDPNRRRLELPAEFFFFPLETRRTFHRKDMWLALSPHETHNLPRILRLAQHKSVLAGTSQVAWAADCQESEDNTNQGGERASSIVGSLRLRVARGNHRPAAMSSGVLAIAWRLSVCCSRQHCTHQGMQDAIFKMAALSSGGPGQRGVNHDLLPGPQSDQTELEIEVSARREGWLWPLGRL